MQEGEVRMNKENYYVANEDFYLTCVIKTFCPMHAKFDSVACDSKGMISDILGVNKSDVVLLDGSNYCHLNDSNCDWQNKKTLKVLYVQGEKNSNIAGGKNANFYHLECKTAGAFVASVNTSIQLPNQPAQVYTVATMTPTQPTKNISLDVTDRKGNAASVVHIGDLLLLKITGPDGYTVDPIVCSASSAKANTDYVLWKNETCASEDKAVIENDWKQDNTSQNIITVQMYGFRFVDSDKVVVKCDALFCPTGVCRSHHCENGTTSRRKKRDAGLESKSENGYIEEHISTYFTVVDKRMDTSACSGTFVSVFTYVTAFVLMFAIM
ncbi:unnamed protein product [Mytilus coruscus]|uniref:ZP domain-containing protein n=1 Tax=Mytilus coruscus TaxID=42192 RepID=A0A6J8APN7_MYTCO|nr:unnamed protein product [Mytilus coruscus]